jgi:hypothetical protein
MAGVAAAEGVLRKEFHTIAPEFRFGPIVIERP